MKNKKKPRILSLFTGAGGLDIGFHQEGFDIVACVEIDRDACDTLEANAEAYFDPNTKIFCGDVTKISPSELRSEIGEVDFMIGGPPCQSFSAAGRRAGGVYGVNDTRGSLFWYYAQLIKEFKPKGFLFENVKGILQANKKSDWETIKAAFSELGYTLRHSIVDAADFGTPQHRERVILVGIKDEKAFRFPRPTHGPNGKSGQAFVRPIDAFSDIDDPSEVVPTYTGKYGSLLKDIPAGFNYLFYTERMGHPNPLFAWRSKFSGFLYKLDPNEPSKTLVAHQGKYDGPFHWRSRKLTIPELVRIQGFPVDYRFCGAKISIQKQIGNSVAPKMGRALALAVKAQLFGSKNCVDLLAEGEVLKRPLRKRVAPNRPVNCGESSDPNQLKLFPVAIAWKTSRRKLKVEIPSIAAQCTLKGGLLKIDAKSSNANASGQIWLGLSFHSPVADAFERIECSLDAESGFEFSFAWDCIHKSIEYFTSYQDLAPLYGHFTEPYPKFKIESRMTDLQKGPESFLNWVSDYRNLAKTHPSKKLLSILKSSQDFHLLASKLRACRVDIRIHETNRTIPDGQFRICYPFTIPSWQPTFVNWQKTGSHKTADLKIGRLLKSEK